MNRETKKSLTPIDKHEVVFNTWVTGGEKRALREVFLGKMKFDLKGTGETSVKELSPNEIMVDAENKAIEIVVVSINGKSDNNLNEILNMKEKDYDFVINEINKVTSGMGFTKPE